MSAKWLHIHLIGALLSIHLTAGAQINPLRPSTANNQLTVDSKTVLKGQARDFTDPDRLRRSNILQEDASSSRKLGIDVHLIKESGPKSQRLEFSLGTGSSGGGDAKLIEALPFPDRNKLNLALDKILITIESSPYNAQFREALAQEILSLRASSVEKFLVLPALVLLGMGHEPKGYKNSGSPFHFISLGASTAFETGAPIYFAEKLVTYLVDDLAFVILHETIHHILPVRISSDEEFVENLTRSIVEGTFSKDLEIGIRYSIYIRPDVIPRSQFIAALGIEELQAKLFMSSGKVQISEIDQRLSNDLPSNIADISIAEFKVKIIRAILNGKRDVGAVQDLNSIINKTIQSMASKFGISTDERSSNFQSWSCDHNGAAVYFASALCEARGKPTVADVFKF